MCRTCVLYELINGLLWDRAVFSSVIELRVTHSKGLGFFKSQEINEMKYLSRPLKSMEDWIYGSLPWPKFTNAAKQLSVSSGKWLTTLSPIRAFDFVSNARLWKNKKIWARRSPKGSAFFTKTPCIFFICYVSRLLGWKQTSDKLRCTSINLRYYAYQQTKWWRWQ